MARKGKRRRSNDTLSKATAQRLHFRGRCLQRFGQYITKELEQQLTDQVTHRLAKFVYCQSTRVSVFELVLPNGAVIWAPYDRNRKTLITALEPCQRRLERNRTMQEAWSEEVTNGQS